MEGDVVDNKTLTQGFFQKRLVKIGGIGSDGAFHFGNGFVIDL